jgi:hypothetical protein
MNDIEKAIEVLKEQYITVSKCLFAEEATERNNAISLAIQALEEKLNGGWIPVSERLPNNCGLGVLLTIANKFQQRKVIQGFTGYMEKGKLEFHTNDKTTNLEIWKVIAWQPLPEPYKEVGQ